MPIHIQDFDAAMDARSGAMTPAEVRRLDEDNAMLILRVAALERDLMDAGRAIWRLEIQLHTANGRVDGLLAERHALLEQLHRASFLYAPDQPR
jgi:hypothetical protein